MLKDGEYAAWFKTARGQGTGRVSLRDGQISGRDTGIAYGGTYRIEGCRFDAVLTTTRHAPGPPSVFGIDEVEIKLAGTVIGNFASCSGEVHQVPGMLFEALLMPMREHEVRQPRLINPADFHPEKLPKPSSR